MTTLTLNYKGDHERTLTVISASYADKENKALSVHTQESGHVLLSLAKHPEILEQLSEISIAPFALTIEEKINIFETAVQKHLDQAANAAGYDDIKTAVTYADEPSVAKFQNEGKAFREWRSLVWEYCYDRLEAIQAGHESEPTVSELIAELPVLDIPNI